MIKIDEHDLMDLLGELSLQVHFIFDGNRIDKKPLTLKKIEMLLASILHILYRYTPRTDELTKELLEFSEIISAEDQFINAEIFLMLYDCFTHDFTEFIMYAKIVGMSDSNKHVIYDPTYKSMQQLMAIITGKEIVGSGGIEFF